MLVYSKKIISFVQEINTTIKRILSQELGLKVGHTRFYDKKQRISYPLKVVIFDSGSMLGYFDANFYELGFHACLMHASREQRHDVIRHELAHYLTYIQHGSSVQAHGAEFKALCHSLGWKESVSRATVCLEGGECSAQLKENGILRKVQKLMALASSSNSNEAELAMIKSQQLLLKHNLETPCSDAHDDDALFLKRIMQQKKITAKMRAIGRILETFFVSIVYSKSQHFVCLEILGNAINIEIAEYVASVLDADFETLWAQAQAQMHLKGTVAKNSFFTGIAKGYCAKIEALERTYPSAVMQSLMVIEKQLTDAKTLVYPHLSSSRSQGALCKRSSSLGEQMGRQLSINPALNRAPKTTSLLLT